MAAVTKLDKMPGAPGLLSSFFLRRCGVETVTRSSEETMETQKSFTQGPILSALLKFALPVLLALLLQAMYGAVDLQVVGKFGTAADISAVSPEARSCRR